MFTEKAKVVNVTTQEVTFQISTVAGAPPIEYKLAPGEAVDVEGGYAARLQPPGRDPQPSIVEKLTGGRVKPATDPEAQAVLARKKAPAAKEPAKQ